MNKPIIALSSTPTDDGYVKVTMGYLDSIFASGAIPMLLSERLDDEYIDLVCETVDGFLFCGGDDLDPSFYGEEPSPLLGNICSLRDEFEYKLFKAAYKTGKPIFGICRGMQIINVFLGGSLCQHIDGHKQTEPRNTLTHKVFLKQDGMLHGLLHTDSIAVNSFHHQVVNRLADRLLCDAVSDDNYIEAVYQKDHPFLLGVQWHPEGYYSESETSSRLFEAFVNACRTGKI